MLDIQDHSLAAGADAPGRCRVLVADDSAIVQAVLEKQLHALGCDVAVAADGLAAFERWKGEPFDLILSDLNMPRMDGFELARAVRAYERFKGRAHTGFVAVSGRADDKTTAACRDLDMDDFIAKPVSTPLLQELLSRFACPGGGAPARPQ